MNKTCRSITLLGLIICLLLLTPSTTWALCTTLTTNTAKNHPALRYYLVGKVLGPPTISSLIYAGNEVYKRTYTLQVMGGAYGWGTQGYFLPAIGSQVQVWVPGNGTSVVFEDYPDSQWNLPTNTIAGFAISSSNQAFNCENSVSTDTAPVPGHPNCYQVNTPWGGFFRGGTGCPLG